MREREFAQHVSRNVAAWVAAALVVVLLPTGTACKGKGDEIMAMNRDDTGPKALNRKVLDSPVAGSWYPADPVALRKELENSLAAADVTARRTGSRVAGIVSPHAGYRYSRGVAAFGYRLLQGQAVRRVIVMGPSHHVAFQGMALPDATHWRTPLGEVPIDTTAVASLAKVPGFEIRPGAFAREHSVDMQVPFIQLVAPQAVLVPIVVGNLTPQQVRAAANAIHPLLDEGTVLVASSDFTHYGENFGYVPFRSDVPENLKRLADDALAALQSVDAAAFDSHQERTGDTICGHSPIQVLLEALPRTVEATVLKYDTSGRMTGDWAQSVSYASVAFQVPPDRREFQGIQVLSDADQRFLLELARETLRRHLADRPLPDPEREGKLPDSVKRDYGVFVTLKEHGDLRGCIGSIVAVEPFWEGVIRNTVNAAQNDSRFSPVRSSEEPLIQMEISVLTPLAAVRGPEDIAVGRDGVLLTKGRNRAVFLPQVAPEQGWDLPTTLTHLSSKAGLPGDAWKSGTTFEVFQAQVFHEKALEQK